MTRRAWPCVGPRRWTTAPTPSSRPCSSRHRATRRSRNSCSSTRPLEGARQVGRGGRVGRRVRRHLHGRRASAGEEHGGRSLAGAVRAAAGQRAEGRPIVDAHAACSASCRRASCAAGSSTTSSAGGPTPTGRSCTTTTGTTSSWPVPSSAPTKRNASRPSSIFGRELVRGRGVKLDAFVWDDGWDDFNSLWGFHKGFPDGFKKLKAAGEQLRRRPGRVDVAVGRLREGQAEAHRLRASPKATRPMPAASPWPATSTARPSATSACT